MAVALTVEEIRDGAALSAIADEWKALWRASAATVFTTPEWLTPWCEAFGCAALRTVALRRGGDLVGLGLFQLRPDVTTGERTLCFLGDGVSDHHELLLHPDIAPAGTRAVVEYLEDIADEWDSCDLRLLPETAEIGRAPLSGPIRAIDGPDESCPVLPLPRASEALAEVIPSHFLRSVRYSARRAARIAALSWQSVAAETCAPLLDALFSLHGARWRALGESGVLGDPYVQRFHRLAAPRLLSAGLLRLHALIIGEAIGAVYYGFCEGTRASYYLSGFDPRFAKLSLGNVVVLRAIEEAISEGAREFDFLRGREPYKYAWGARDRSTVRRRIVHAAVAQSASWS